MNERRFVFAAVVGSALAAGVFFVVLDNALSDERWAMAVAYGIGFGSVMALWNGLLIHLDSRQRTSRNILFEHFLAQTIAILVVAWALTPAVSHLRWQELAWYTIGAAPFLLLVHFATRRSIKGEDPDELFA